MEIIVTHLFSDFDTQNIFKAVSSTAKKLKYRAYLVGGMVRDLFLGKQNFDIDIVVEGDGIIFAKKLSEILNAHIDCYEKFKTAVLILKNGYHIDIASSRIEYYKKPAALPEVEMGSIKQDLARRDFTINTIFRFREAFFTYRHMWCFHFWL